MNETSQLDFTRFEAVLFDLDGVITKTAGLHAAAWKRLFDEYLERQAARGGSQFEPFDLEKDYRLYVDGKPRYDGVKSFLDSRGLTLPWGAPTDGPDEETICGLGNKKDQYFEAQLREADVVVYPSTVRCLRLAKASGLKSAVVSSSHHCRQIIDAVGLTALFESLIDGHEIDRLHLRGKPAPVGGSGAEDHRDRRCPSRCRSRTGWRLRAGHRNRPAKSSRSAQAPWRGYRRGGFGRAVAW